MALVKSLEALVAAPTIFTRLRQRAHSRFLQYVTAASLALACSKADTFSVSAKDAQVPPDTQVQQCFDQDHDGFYAGVNDRVNCGTPIDCNDNDSTVFPGSLEICDRKDNNCNLQTDEGVQVPLYEDKDKDDFGNPEKTKLGCYIPGMDPDIDEQRYVPNNDDCDDEDFLVNPAALEVCDGLDNNCKDGIDEGLLSTYCVDVDGDGKGDAADFQEACGPFLNYVSDCSDCNDDNENIWQLVNVYTDADFDGYGSSPVGLCVGSFVPPGYSLNDFDCNDSMITVHPGALEICDLYDNDCDPATLDGSGEIPPLNTLQQGVCADSLKSCLNGSWTDDYSGVIGYETVEASWQTACDGLDNDCDGEIDPLSQAIFYFDGDNDGFGDSNNSVSGCSPLENYEALGSDCNDSNADINPEALEVCDGYNNDCNQATADGSDEQAPYNTLQEGVCADSYRSCINGSWQNNYTSIPNYEALETICDTLDNDCDGLTDETCSSCTPIAEICDGLDNDCDGTVDENLIAPTTTCYAWTGSCISAGLAYKTCLGVNGWSAGYSNCDAIPPTPSDEICDGVDNDCDGETDENCEGNICETFNEIIDLFNRPDGSNLGVNNFGNPWSVSGPGGDEFWTIFQGALVRSSTGYYGGDGRTSVASAIGNRDSFNMYVRFRLSNPNANPDSVFMLSINAGGGTSDDGFTMRTGGANGGGHVIQRNGADLAFESQPPIQADTWYSLKFSYLSGILGLKIWEDGAPEPVNYLISAPATNVSGTMIKFSGYVGEGQNLTTTIDYVIEGCEE